MKKLPKYFSLVAFAMIVWGAFSVSHVDAALQYSQLTDNSTLTSLYAGTTCYIVIAEFSPSTNESILGSILQAAFHAGPTTNTSLTAYLSTSSPSELPDPNCGVMRTVGVQNVRWDFTLNTLTNPNYTVIATTTVPDGCSLSYCSNYDTTEHYYVYIETNPFDSDLGIWGSNFVPTYFFGYIQGGQNNPGNIGPGISGYTDFGISTSSQQVYCAQNFASTTGILDGIARGFSVGLCNVGVFLFVPSTGSINQWQNLATTTKSKIPFSYMYQVAADVYGLSASSSDNFINVEIDMSGWASSSIVTLPQSWTVLSTSTVSQYYPDSIRILFRTLMATIVWLGFILWVYHKALNALHKPTV